VTASSARSGPQCSAEFVNEISPYIGMAARHSGAAMSVMPPIADILLRRGK
jgi:hypothetical protein